MTAPVDHQRLLAEIDEEVRRKRESGDLPAGFERELDLVFARYAPVQALEGDFAQVLARAEEATFIDVLAPYESSRPVVPLFKRVVRKVILWVVRYVAQQVSAFAQAITRAVRLLGERVEALEDAVPTRVSAAARPATGPATAPDPEHWAGVLVPHLVAEAPPGRVLHAESGDGWLVERLLAAGLDGYGTEPTEELSLAASECGLEIRTDTATAHLTRLEDGSLAAVILSGCVDRLPLGAQRELADLACAKVVPGGVVAVIGTEPDAWATDRSSIEADLAPGRPLRAETWRWMLAERGLADGAIYTGPRPDALPSVPAGRRDATAAALNATIDRLNEALYRPRSYAVVTTRPPASDR